MKRLYYMLALAAAIPVLFSPVVYGQMPGNGMMGSGTPTFPGWEGHEMNQNLILPQVAVGDHYVTTLILMNLGNAQQMSWVSPQNLTTTGKIYLYNQDGTRMPVSINGASPATEIAFSLDPSKTVKFDLASPGSDKSGWALIAVDDSGNNSSWGMMDNQQMMRGRRLIATLFYTYRNGAQTVSRVGVIPSLYEMNHYFTSVLAAESQDDIYTGVAIVNTNAKPVSIQLTLKDANGQVVATKQLSLAAGSQFASFINQIFGNSVPSRLQGSMEVDASDEGIVTLGLLVSQGILTSIPTMHYGQITSRMMP